MSHVLVVGSVAFDTLHLPSGSHKMVLGGSATFGALAASRFTRAQLVGVVGRDFPDSAHQLLRDHKIDATGLEIVDGKTFHWEGRYSSDLSSRETLATDLNVFASFDPKIPELFRDTPFVMLGNIEPGLQRRVLEQVKKPKLVIADTMNFWITGSRASLLETLSRVDGLLLNDEEARLLAGEHNLVKAAKSLMRLGPRFVVVKKGEHGALLFEGEDVFSAPAFPTSEVLDPTGAGDAFAGAMIGYCAAQNDTSHATIRSAVIYGAVLGSFCVEGVSTSRLATVTDAEIAARFARFRSLVHFASSAELA